MLVFNGAYDTQTGLAGARHVADHLPNAYYVEIPTIGHAVLFEVNPSIKSRAIS